MPEKKGGRRERMEREKERQKARKREGVRKKGNTKEKESFRAEGREIRITKGKNG